MAERTPVEELHDAARKLLSNPKYGGIPWISLAPPDVIGIFAALFAEIAEEAELQEPGAPTSLTMHLDTAEVLARAINRSQP